MISIRCTATAVFVMSLVSQPLKASAQDSTLFALPANAQADLTDSQTRKANWHGLLTRFQERFYERDDGQGTVKMSWITLGYALGLFINETNKSGMRIVLRYNQDKSFDVFRSIGFNGSDALVGKANWRPSGELEIALNGSVQTVDFSGGMLRWSVDSRTLRFSEINDDEYAAVRSRMVTAEIKARTDSPAPEWLRDFSQALNQVATQLETQNRAARERAQARDQIYFDAAARLRERGTLHAETYIPENSDRTSSSESGGSSVGAGRQADNRRRVPNSATVSSDLSSDGSAIAESTTSRSDDPRETNDAEGALSSANQQVSTPQSTSESNVSSKNASVGLVIDDSYAKKQKAWDEKMRKQNDEYARAQAVKKAEYEALQVKGQAESEKIRRESKEEWDKKKCKSCQ